jgi:hypothetical protein
MWHDAKEIRVNGGQTLTRCKWSIFFVAFFVFFFSVNSAFSAQSDCSSHAVTVQAVVPVQPGFVQAVANRSQVILAKNGLYPGEKGAITIVLKATGQETLRFHRLLIDRIAASGETTRLGMARTDRGGRAIFSFVVETSWSGHQHIRVTDVTYDKSPILLDHQPLLRVLQPPTNPSQELEDWEQQEKSAQTQVTILDYDTFSTSPSSFVGSVTREKQNNSYFAEMCAGP